jgi:protein-tyrosine phosphatase
VIDLHFHLLPGIDDGPTTLGESLTAAQAAAADGVRTVAATPHIREDHPRVRLHELRARCDELNDLLAEKGAEIEVVSGGEVDLVWAQEASDEDLRLVSYGQRGTDLLVETPYGPLLSTFDDFVFGLQVRGYRILLAHPERNPTFQEDPARLAALVERGALLQVSAGAVAAARRKSSRSRRLATWLVERGLSHVIASDAHGFPSRGGPLSSAVAAVEAEVGARAHWMVTAAPLAILAGEPLPPPPARLLKKRRLLSR